MKRITLSVILILILVACSPTPTPEIIVVTATPKPTAAPTQTPEPSREVILLDGFPLIDEDGWPAEVEISKGTICKLLNDVPVSGKYKVDCQDRIGYLPVGIVRVLD